MRTQEIKTKTGTIEVIELTTCFVANILYSAPTNALYSESEVYALKQRFMMWLDSGTYSDAEWNKYSKELKGYRFAAFVKGKNAN